MRSIALNSYLCVIAVLLVRAASASETTPLPIQTDSNGVFVLDSGAWRVGIALAVLVGLVFLVQWLMRKQKGGGIGHLASGRAIQIIDRKALGPRQYLLLVQVGKRRVLLHQGKGTLSPMCEFEVDSKEDSS